MCRLDRPRRQVWKLLCTSLAATAAAVITAGAIGAQTWETQATEGTNEYFQPDHPLAFVAAEINEVPDWDGSGITGSYHVGG